MDLACVALQPGVKREGLLPAGAGDELHAHDGRTAIGPNSIFLNAVKHDTIDLCRRIHVDPLLPAVQHVGYHMTQQPFVKIGSTARKITSTRRVCVSQPPTTGEGHVQFVTVPGGASSATSR